MSNFNKLLDFCNKYRFIYCYGAGYIGDITKKFLNKYDININGYIVSEKEEEYVNGTKVYCLNELNLDVKDETGIVLSLDEKHHDFVSKNIARYKFENIFYVSSKDVNKKMKIDLSEGIISLKNVKYNLASEALIHGIYQIEQNKKSNFENKYLEKYSSYKKIIVAPCNMVHIGQMCLTYYLWNIENGNDKDILYLMIPNLINQDYKKIPNNYFLEVFQEKMVVLTEENYEFWKWMLQHHADKLEFSDYYDYEEVKKRDTDYILKEPLFEVELNKDDRKIIKSMNLKKDFICIYSRDNEYYKHLEIEQNTDEYEYATKARNSSIKDFDLVAYEFSNRDIDFVRMGHKVEGFAGKNIIDYANKFRTEKLDFYLLSKCRFFMVSGSGIMVIALLFAVPLVVINASVLSFGGDSVAPMSPERDLIIMKKLWYPKQKRYLTLDEILYMEGKFLTYGLLNEYKKLGIVFESNSPEELLDIAVEMDKRINGKMVYTKEEENMQEKYRTILENHISSNKLHFYNGRFGTDFLKKNPWFLEKVPEELSIRNIL